MSERVKLVAVGEEKTTKIKEEYGGSNYIRVVNEKTAVNQNETDSIFMICMVCVILHG